MKAFIKRLAVKCPLRIYYSVRDSRWTPKSLRQFVQYRINDRYDVRSTMKLRRLKSIASQYRISDRDRLPPVVSFDFYDTLFTRLTELPTDIYHYIGYVLCLNHYIDDASEFCRLRQAAEDAARNMPDEAGERPGDVGLEDIYRAFQTISNWTCDTIAAAKDLEIKLEISVLTPRQAVLDLARNYRSRGCRLIITSDTYMSASFIREALAPVNANSLFDEVYTSSDQGKRKDSGTIWPLLVKQEAGDRAEQLLHIGDNPHSDLQVPRDLGVTVYPIPHTATLAMARGLPVSEVTRYKHHDWKAGIILGPAVAMVGSDPFASLEEEPLDLGTAYRFGYAVFGSLMFAFQSWLMQHIRRENIDRIFFLARDGYFLHKTFCMLNEKFGILPSVAAEYLYVSRRSVLPAASSKKFDVDFILRDYYEGQLAGLFAQRLGIDVTNLFEETDSLAPIDLSKDRNRLLELCARYRTQIVELCTEKFAPLYAYLQSSGLATAANPGVVDLGFSGTIQHCLQTVLDRSLIGYYFRTEPAVHAVTKTGGLAFECFPQNRYAKDITPVRAGSLVLEAILAAPHGQVSGYTSAGAPIYVPTPDAGEEFQTISDIAKGMEDYCGDLARAFGPEIFTIDVPMDVAQAPMHAFLRGRMVLPEALKKALVVEALYNGENSALLNVAPKASWRPSSI